MMGTVMSMFSTLSIGQIKAAPTGPKCFVIGNISGTRIEIEIKLARSGSFVQPKASWRIYGKYNSAFIAEPTMSTLRRGEGLAAVSLFPVQRRRTSKENNERTAAMGKIKTAINCELTW